MRGHQTCNRPHLSWYTTTDMKVKILLLYFNYIKKVSGFSTIAVTSDHPIIAHERMTSPQVYIQRSARTTSSM
uniref:Uncharacterized protein n=1 Tax=Arundo donax TaxID=35708 RepID=A0A0A9DE72_ARUDO